VNDEANSGNEADFQWFASESTSGEGQFPPAAELPPHWRALKRNLDKLGSRKLESRRKEAQRLLRENGATYNIFDPADTARSWRFDPLPLIFSSDEWEQLEVGLIQRAELLKLILADIYGPRDLLAKGLLPAELIFAHRGFLFPCVGLVPAGGHQLTLYSADLTRDADGRFWVVEDHTHPPFGAGYALENRIIMNRSFPRMFMDYQVHRLAMYFRALRNSLALLAPHGKADPRIIVLTPGPEHETFFEHSYLAAYLGYPLVHGDDLVVRDGCVWLKSVDGLRQVDVILRRVKDELCDPLELHGDSLFGVPGLLEAIRLGNVATANPIGSGVLENPALMAFLPSLCRHFFGEELRLPSLATWWCGQPQEREFVLQNLERLVIKPIHPLPNLPKAAPGQWSKAQLDIWRERILAEPHLFVGQEPASFSTVPSFVTSRIEPRQYLLSTYLATQQQSYVVLPGGLTRIDAQSSGPLFQKLERTYCKDTWVLTREPDKQVNLWRQARPDQLIQPLFGSLPSRAAESLFWAGRYVERAEGTSRLLRSVLIKLRDLNEFHDPDDRQILDHLLPALTHVTATYPGFTGAEAGKRLLDPRAELLSLARDLERPGSLRSSLQRLGRSVYAVRDLIPEDAWRVVENMQQNWNPKVTLSQIGGGQLYDSVNQLILQLSAFSGLLSENMSRETAWQLLNTGRRLERALNLIALLRVTLVPYGKPALEAQMMETVLATCNSLVVFRRRYRSFMQLPTILELLLMDENYPRALAYQLRQLEKHIEALPREAAPGPDQELIAAALAELRETDHKRLTQIETCEEFYPDLEERLQTQQERLEELSEVLMQLYFSPTLHPQQLGAGRQEKAI